MFARLVLLASCSLVGGTFTILHKFLDDVERSKEFSEPFPGEDVRKMRMTVGIL